MSNKIDDFDLDLGLDLDEDFNTDLDEDTKNKTKDKLENQPNEIDKIDEIDEINDEPIINDDLGSGDIIDENKNDIINEDKEVEIEDTNLENGLDTDIIPETNETLEIEDDINGEDTFNEDNYKNKNSIKDKLGLSNVDFSDKKILGMVIGGGILILGLIGGGIFLMTSGNSSNVVKVTQTSPTPTQTSTNNIVIEDDVDNQNDNQNNNDLAIETNTGELVEDINVANNNSQNNINENNIINDDVNTKDDINLDESIEEKEVTKLDNGDISIPLSSITEKVEFNNDGSLVISNNTDLTTKNVEDGTIILDNSQNKSPKILDFKIYGLEDGKDYKITDNLGFNIEGITNSLSIDPKIKTKINGDAFIVNIQLDFFKDSIISSEKGTLSFKDSLPLEFMTKGEKKVYFIVNGTIFKVLTFNIK